MDTKTLRLLGEESDDVEILDTKRRKKYKAQIQKIKELLITNKNALVELKSIFQDFNYHAYFEIDVASLNIMTKNTSMSGGFPGLIASIDLQSKSFTIILESYIPVPQIKLWSNKFKFLLYRNYTSDLNKDIRNIDFFDVYIYDNL